ncbi:MAG TPA: 3'-5' exonuclease, partial [Hyphomicrobiales bacterium]|nr:3'-5' exonuclease [Hyphomicrobiales bacterium]
LPSGNDPVEHASAQLRSLFGAGAGETLEELAWRSTSVLDVPTLRASVAHLAAGGPADAKSAARFQAVLDAKSAAEKRLALLAAFTTKAGEPRKSLITSAAGIAAPDLNERLSGAQSAFIALEQKMSGLKVVEATSALLHLTAAIFECYELRKRKLGALDFDDLIDKSLSLLSREGAAEWVLYELDSRIDHILIDEAQDNSPEQWAIVERFTSDFFAGEGARVIAPTLLAVGDEKQSIYGFQGAAPALLADYGYRYQTAVKAARLPWRAVNLDLSFRTLEPVLSAVDKVAQASPGFREGALAPHRAFRREDGGVVELWETEQGEKQEKGTVWDEEAENAQEAGPAARLARRIAAQIRHWLNEGERLASSGRPIRPSDILILLRKRDPMAGLLQRELKRAGIAVAGNDRMALIEEVAILDLLFLADFLLEPEDDLALAVVLKSPLFGFTEEELFALAHAREGSLWAALQKAAFDSRSKYSEAAAKLRTWRRLSAESNPYDFYSHILEGEGARRAFAKRLGTACFEALDQFVDLAESFGARVESTLAEFLAFVRTSASEVKREMEQASSEVRIMTVHGAKGLEANIVILADSCGTPAAPNVPIFFSSGDGRAAQFPIWAIKGSSSLPPIAEAKAGKKAAEQREFERLLYVAMTRARDRLYIAGFHNGSLPENCWYNTIKTALSPSLREERDFAGRRVFRVGFSPDAGRGAVAEAKLAQAQIPTHLTLPPQKEAAPRICAPSRLAEAADEKPRSGAGQGEAGRRMALAAGRLIHRLLEVLPSFEAQDRLRVAAAIASAFSKELPLQRRKEAIAAALEIAGNGKACAQWKRSLREAELAALFGEGSDRPTIILAKADNIQVDGARIAIIDYKSGRSSPEDETQQDQLAQINLYRHALQRLYPKADVRAKIFNTRSKAEAEAPQTAIEDLLRIFSP